MTTTNEKTWWEVEMTLFDDDGAFRTTQVVAARSASDAEEYALSLALHDNSNATFVSIERIQRT